MTKSAKQTSLKTEMCPQAVWQVVRDAAGVDHALLEGTPGGRPSAETDLRLVLRVLFLSPVAPPRNVRLQRPGRGVMLRTLVSKLEPRQQARLLFVCYGPRSGRPQVFH